MNAPTPVPWMVDWRSIRRATPDADSGAQPVLCTLGSEETSDSEDEANARFIVLACNSHYDLLQALRAVLPWAEDDKPEQPEFAAARAAIAKAEAAK